LHALGYSEPGVGRFFPTEGLRASVAVPNPPLFVYVVAIPLAVVRSPVAVAAVIAAANVIAVWLCVVVGTRIYSRFVGLVAAALFAVAPWSVVFSRKIWAQDLLPLVAVLFMLELHALIVEGRRRAPATLLLLTAAAIQLHFSGVALVPVLVLAFALARDRVSRGALAVGTGGSVLLYLPFLIVHGGALLHSHAHSALPPPVAVHRLANAIHLTAAISSADQLRNLVGSSTRLAEPIGLLLAAIAAAGLAIACAGRRDDRRALVRRLILLWYVLPAALLTAVPVTPYIHYFIVLLPIPFFGIASALEAVRRRVPSLSAAAALLAVAYFAFVDARLYRIVRHDGGAPADYGVAYRYKKALVDEAIGSGHGRAVSFAAAGYGRGSEYRLLAWSHEPAEPPAGTVRRYTVVDTLAGERPRAGARPAFRVGPLLAVPAK
jgi:hypothetical protein